MKTLIAMFTCITLTTLAADEFREFTASDGRTLNAKVLSYDGELDTVEIQRDDLHVCCVKSTTFSEADQAYIKEWAPSSLFMSPLKFKIIPRRIVNKSNWSREGGSEQSPLVAVSECQYEIAICNRTGLPMENLTMDYIIYYASDLPLSVGNTYPHEHHTWTNQEGLREEWSLVSTPGLKLVKGSIPIGGLGVDGWQSFTTDRVAVLQQQAEDMSESATSISSVSGILVTISMATPDGGHVERSFSLPKSMEQDFLQNLTNERRTAVTRSFSDKRNS